jgi:N-acyl-D-amino-acid deacylase
MTDLLFRAARIIDGSGAPWFRGDLLVHAGRIGAIGTGLDAAGATVVAAEDRYLAPGFIDAHCHDDLICLREPDRPEKVAQGVATVVVGNCSFSLYPATEGSAEALREHFAALLGEVSAAEVFDGVAAYRDALHRQGVAINVVSLVGHAALRLAVLGYDRRPASPAQIRTMQERLARQLAAGAAGLSLGLVYPPSAYADDAELLALAATVRAHGKLLAAHIRSYEGGLDGSIDEFIGLLVRSGAAGLLSHLQSAGRPNWGNIPAALAKLEAVRKAEVDVSFDMYPYPAGSTTLLQLLPPDALEGGLPALLARLADPVQRAALRRRVEQGDPGVASKVALIGWNNVRLSAIGAERLKPLEGCSIGEAAQRTGIDPFDLMVRCIEEDGGQTGIVLFQLDESDLRAACTHRLHMVGSDGLPRPGTLPHPRAWGTFPRVAGRLVREAGWFALEDAVRRMTSLPAQRFGLYDRGLLRPGMVADLVLFDAAIEDRATFEAPAQLATGVWGLWVAGEPVRANGQPTGRRPGRLLG